METYYLNLIAKSYIKLTKENDDNLALFFFQKYSKLKRKTPKNRFYKKLKENLENLINNSYTKAKEPDLSGIPDEHLDDYILGLKTKENNYFAAMDQYSDYCAEEGLPNNTPNWEICTDATKLTNALNNEYVKLKDPINIITPSKKISKKELIVRKSKLEYLKREAKRASKVKSTDELDEIPVIETPTPSVVGTSPNKNDGSIKTTVQNAFKFTLTINLRQKRHILSQQDYNNLVKCVTEYFDNDLTVPEIIEPIEKFYTAKGNIVQAFKDLFAKLEPGRSNSKPDTYFDLISLCFKAFSGKTRKQIDGEKYSIDYYEIVKKNL